MEWNNSRSLVTVESRDLKINDKRRTVAGLSGYMEDIKSLTGLKSGYRANTGDRVRMRHLEEPGREEQGEKTSKIKYIVH